MPKAKPAPEPVMQDHPADSYHSGTPVLEFHEVFGHPVELQPVVPDMAVRLLRVKLIAEELVELSQASGVILHIDFDKVRVEPTARESCDLVEVADALGDLRYVVDGGNLVYGIPGEMVLHEIHRSNMSKLDEHGQPIYREDGKILKGENYSPPDIRSLLEMSGMEVID